MNSQITLARPYARAIFDIACAEKMTAAWSEALDLLSHIASHPALQAAYHDPRYTPEEISDIFITALKKTDLFNKNIFINFNLNLIENLIFLLGRYRRLVLLPVMAKLYETHRAETEKNIRVSLTSAFDVPEPLQISFKQVLEKRLPYKVDLVFSKNSDLIGGAVLSSGDWVIDYSVKHQLAQLKHRLIS